jgi:phenylpropionate dioxygenase-like ring-hydroxylating dioxygenase large terminal subunit
MTERLFDVTTYAGTRRPVREAETLPPAAYTSAEFYQREVERIFLREWNFMGRADHLREPGDYAAFEFAGVPLIIVRDRRGGLRAFSNSCRHRGTQLVEGEGHCKNFRCPYHSWVYDLDGALLAAPEMGETVAFDRSRYGLVPIKLETWGGFVFVNFDPQSSSLAEYLSDLPGHLSSYGLDDLVCVRRKEYELACNWKIFVENAMEEYHIATVHRATIQQNTAMDTHGPEEPRGQSAILYSEHEGSMALLKGETGFPPIATLAGKPARGTYFVLVYPSTMLGLTRDCVWYLELRPQGPRRTRLIHGACFPRRTVAREDFDQVVTRYYWRWDKTADEDVRASEWQQKGLESPFSRPGRFSFREVLVHEIDNWILDRVLDRA